MKEVYAPDGCYLSVKLDSAAIEKLHLEIDAHAVLAAPRRDAIESSRARI